ncbi:MAG: hypothetical protein IK066_01165 [Kiritimatiellae bacterium]|nr:hypothetical protein [Kiritimatiellia bacterium]
MKKTAIGISALLLAASMAMAGALNQFKAGDISVSLLDKDGATPLQTASVKAIDAESGAVAAEAVSDELGQAVLALDAGRYVMNVNDRNLAVFDVDPSEGLSVCRIIIADAALLAGGQDDSNGEESGAAVGVGSWLPIVGGIAAALVVGGVAWAVIDHNDGHSSGGGNDIVSTTTTTTANKSHTKHSTSPSSK